MTVISEAITGFQMNKPKEYLQDPDEQMEAIAFTWSEPVQGEVPEEAEEKCQKLADEYGLHLNSTERRGDSDWYDCNFRGK